MVFMVLKNGLLFGQMLIASVSNMEVVTQGEMIQSESACPDAYPSIQASGCKGSLSILLCARLAFAPR